jgi:hypothetical protein
MPIAYEVKKMRSSNADVQLSVQNGNKKVVRTMEEEWTVLLDYRTIDADVPDPVVVTKFAGVPKVGGWSYFDQVNNIFYPNFTCRSVSCERDTQNAFLYRLSVSYSDESDDDSGQGAQPDPENYNPTINWSLESKGVTCYTDNTGNKNIKLPTGNFYDGLSPVREVPIFIATIEQIDNFLSLPLLEARYKKVNSTTWNGFQPESCIIDNISYELAEIPVDVGGGNIAYNNAYKVKYTIKCMNHTIPSLTDEGTIEELQAKWGYDLIRMDDFYLSNKSGTLKRYPISGDEKSGYLASWYLKENGGLHEYDKQTGTPPIDQFVVQPKIDFNSFIRV